VAMILMILQGTFVCQQDCLWISFGFKKMDRREEHLVIVHHNKAMMSFGDSFAFPEVVSIY
jgi:hypothetical protein